MKTKKLHKNLFFLALIMFCFTSFSQTPEQIEVLQNLSMELGNKYTREKEKALKKADSLGIPVRQEFGEAGIIELQRFVDGIPIYYTTYNLEGAQVIKSSEVWEGGVVGLSLSGEGQTLGMWDGGATRLEHQELQNRVVQADDATDLSGHATHVAATMVAGGVNSNAKGMSYKANLDAYDWNNDAAQMADAASEGLKVSQHSYGTITGWYWDGADWYWYGNPSISETEDYRFGFYNDRAREWDEIANNAPNYLITKSAGNDRGYGPEPGTGHYVREDRDWVWSTETRDVNGGDDGYDCISTKGNAKNIMTVGAVTANGEMASFSSWGPTDDGRMKPDIVAKGVGVFSATADDDYSYDSWNGTSMSGPMISGSVGLLLEHHEDLHGEGNPLHSSTIKALILHTADEMGYHPGPDYEYGWGMMNTQRAAEVMSENAQKGGDYNIRELTLNNGQSKEITYVPNDVDLLKVTIAWNDPAGTPPEPALNPTDLMLVNDLDMRIEKGLTTYKPWVLDPENPSDIATTGDNFRDNIEQIYIEEPETGETYTITITHKDDLEGGSQDFSLIITEKEIYNLLLNANPEEGGEVDGAGEYEEAQNVTVTATANKGWELINWTDSDGNEVSDKAEFDYTMPAEDVTLTANFEEIPVYTVNFNVEDVYENPIEDAKISIIPVSKQTTSNRLTTGSNNGKYAGLSREPLSAIQSSKTTPVIKDTEKGGKWIHWDDGVNDNSIGAEEGVWTGAIRFEIADIEDYDGMEITEVRTYLANLTDGAAVVIWQGEEGNLTKVVYNPFTPVEDDWIEVKLDEPYTIDASEELWIGIEIDQGDDVFPLGCDAETNHDGKGNLVTFDGVEWNLLTDYGIAGDWNIQAYIEPFVIYTDVNGYASFEAESGDYAYTVEKDGYYTIEDNFTVTDTDKYIDVTLTEAYTLSLLANPDVGGNTEGYGEYVEGEEVTVTATANKGWEFISWTGDTEHIDDADSESQTFTMPADDITLTANFALIDYTVSVSIEPEDAGTVTGDGIYNMGDEVTLEATANTGYEFVNWTDGDGEVSTSAAYTFTMSAEDVHLTANFDLIDYTVSLTVEPEDIGSVTGDGIYNMDDLVNLKATANEGFEFMYWVDVNDAVLHNYPDYNFNMPAEDVILTAYFKYATFVMDADKLELSVYPNPARDKFTVESNDMIKQIKLIDIKGQVIKLITVDGLRVDGLRVELNVNNLHPGIYFLQIYTDESTITKHVQIAR